MRIPTFAVVVWFASSMLDTVSASASSQPDPTGPDSYVDFVRVADWGPNTAQRTIGMAIARLDVRFQRGDRMIEEHCTAFAVTPQLVLSNRHCLHRDGWELVAADLKFNYVEPDSGDTLVLAVDRSTVQHAFGDELDVASFAAEASIPVANVLPRDVLARMGTNQIDSSTRLIIFGHPFATVQSYAENCYPFRSPLLENGHTLRHRCPTETGMSGAPIFAQDDFSLIAIHFKGPDPQATTNDWFASGVLISSLIEELEELRSARLGALEDEHFDRLALHNTLPDLPAAHLPGCILFEVNRSHPRSDMWSFIESFLDTQIEGDPSQYQFRVEGYSDLFPSEGFQVSMSRENALPYSLRRAQAVSDMLVQMGVSPTQIEAEGRLATGEYEGMRRAGCGAYITTSLNE